MKLIPTHQRLTIVFAFFECHLLPLLVVLSFGNWPSGGFPRLSEGKRVIECSIENFVPVVAVTQHRVCPSVDFSPASGNCSPRVEDPSASSSATGYCEQGAEYKKVTDKKPPSKVTDAGEGGRRSSLTEDVLWPRNTRARQESSIPYEEVIIKCSHNLKGRVCEVLQNDKDDMSQM